MTEDPTKQEPAPDPAAKKDPPGDPGDKPPVQDPAKQEPNVLETKLEGDKVPENLRGKTFAEILTMFGETQQKLTTADQELAQWRAHYVANKPAPQQQQQQQQQFDPLKYFDEEQVQALSYMMGAAQAPLLQGVSSMLKEFTRSTRPDFDEHAERAEQIYNNMHPDFKFHPKYGWDYAYKMARVEKEEPPKQDPYQPAPSQQEPPKPKGPPPLDDTEKKWADKQDMSEEEYRKYGTPVDVTKSMEENK